MVLGTFGCGQKVGATAVPHLYRMITSKMWSICLALLPLAWIIAQSYDSIPELKDCF